MSASPSLSIVRHGLTGRSFLTAPVSIAPSSSAGGPCPGSAAGPFSGFRYEL